MRPIWHKRLSNLLSVKSIVTIVMAVVFACLALTGKISSKDFLNIFSMVIAFYFGTQSERMNSVEQNQEQQQKQLTAVESNITLENASKKG